MKLQKIKRICNEAMTYHLYNLPDGQQWIGNGAAAYPVEGITMTAAAIPAVFDIPQKKLEETVIREGDMKDARFCLVPTDDDEALKELGDILYLGGIYKMLLGQGGIICINTDYLKAVETKDSMMRFFARKSERKDGTPLIAVFTDLFVSALIMPVKTAAVEDIQEGMRKMVGYPVWTVDGEKKQEPPVGEQTEMEGGDK